MWAGSRVASMKPMVAQPEARDSPTLKWVRAAQKGDEDSFAKLYEHLAPALLTWAELRIRGEQRATLDPQDLVQEVWYRARRAIDSFDEN